MQHDEIISLPGEPVQVALGYFGAAMIIWRVEDGVALATIDRPEKRNALDIATVADLTDRLSVDGEIAPPVVLTGVGATFCSGFDLSTRGQASDFVEHADRLFASII